jgi:hypothetical protein
MAEPNQLLDQQVTTSSHGNSPAARTGHSYAVAGSPDMLHGRGAASNAGARAGLKGVGDRAERRQPQSARGLTALVPIGAFRTAAAPIFLLGLLAALAFWATGRWDEDLVAQTVIEANSAELNWYKNPTDPAAKERVLRAFVSKENQGERFPRIEETVDSKLNARGRRYADNASQSVILTRMVLDIHRNTATVETHERWYQPLLERQADGQEVPIAPPTGHLLSSDDHQLYTLRKLDGVWKVHSNPVP